MKKVALISHGNDVVLPLDDELLRALGFPEAGNELEYTADDARVTIKKHQDAHGNI